MTKGERLFIGTLFTVTGAGVTAGYVAGQVRNDLPMEVVVSDGIALAAAESTTATITDSLPICARAVLGTLEETGYSANYSAEFNTGLIETQCGEASVPSEVLIEYTDAYTNQQNAAEKYEASIEASVYEKAEKLDFLTIGIIGGWASAWAVAGTGYSINKRRQRQPISA